VDLAKNSQLSERLVDVMADDLKINLIGTGRDDYLGDYDDHLLEQYKLYVEMTDRISQRRQTANIFFLTINTALVALLGAAVPSGLGLLESVWYVIVGLAGVVLSFSWYRLVCSYRDLNSAKFKVVHEIEQHLPLRPYEAEWKTVGQGEESKLYLPFTHIETRVPWVFMLLYVALIAASFLR